MATHSGGGATEADEPKGFIKDGTFSDAPAKEYVGDGLVRILKEDGNYTVGTAEGKTPVADEDEIYYENDKAVEANNVAKIGDTYYKTLADAITAAGNTETTITLVNSASENVVIDAGQNITLDLNGKTLTSYIKVTGELTIKDSQGNGKIQANGNYAVYIKDGGKLNLQSGKIVGSYAIYAKGNGTEVNVTGGRCESTFTGIYVAEGASLNVSAGEIYSTYYAISGNGTASPTTINITGGEITANEGYNEQGIGIYHPQNGTLKVSGNTVIKASSGIQMCSGTLEVSGDVKITASGNTYTDEYNDGRIPDGAAISVVHRNYPGGDPKVTIKGGYFSSANNKAVLAYDWSNITTPTETGTPVWADAKDHIFIEKGYFTSDPAEYVVDGKTSVDSDKSGYAYMIGVKDAEAVTVKTATADTEANTDKLQGVTEETDITTVKTSAESVAANETISEAAKAEKLDATTTTQAVEKAKTDLKPAEETEITVFKQTYLDVEATNAKKDDAGKINEITLDITPMMQVVAATTNNANDIQLEGTTPNAVKVGSAKELTITTPSEITVTLPEAFQNQPVFIKHEAKSGTYFYTATAGADGTLTFTSQHGFSPFTFSLENGAAAQITDKDGNTIGYETLQDAVDAVKDGETITVLKDGESAKVTGKKTFTVTGDGADSAELKAGSGYKLSVDGDKYTVKKKKKSSSSSDASDKKYAVSIDDVDNGKVKVDPSKAEEDEKVTITVTPDKGYEIDKVKVTDKDGDKIDIKDKGNGKYTFTMPDSKVEIKVTFKKIEETPVEIEDSKKIILTIDERAALVFDETKINDVAPVIRNERTMLPIRFVVEALGGSIAWNATQRTVTIVKNDTVMVITIGAATASINGQPVLLDAPAFIENSRTYLPLRFVAENLDAQVTWDAETKQVIIIPNEYLK